MVLTILGSLRDLSPIIAVIAFFQIVVVRAPLPSLLDLVAGTALVLAGLTLFMRGLEMGLFPIGESMANAFARKGSLPWLLVFAFSLGFGTTVAEPALIAVSAEAARAAAESGVLGNARESLAGYALGVRLTVAFSVGVALTVGVMRIVAGWPIHYLIIGGYIGVVVMTAFAPPEIIGSPTTRAE